MQYKNYEIQITESGCIIRNSNGNFIIEVETENQAKLWIDEKTKSST